MERKNTIFGQNDWVGIALPIVLICTGAILVGGDYLGMLSLDRVQNLWPLALIVIGIVELAIRG